MYVKHNIPASFVMFLTKSSDLSLFSDNFIHLTCLQFPKIRIIKMYTAMDEFMQYF